MSALITSLFSKFLSNPKQMKVFAKGMGSAKSFADKAKDLLGVNESAGKLLSAFNVLKVPLKLITADLIGPIMGANIELMRELVTATNTTEFQTTLQILNLWVVNFIKGATALVKLGSGGSATIKVIVKLVGMLKDVDVVTQGLNMNLGPMITQLARLLHLVSLPVDSSSTQTYVDYQLAPPNDLPVQPPTGTGDYGDGTIF